MSGKQDMGSNSTAATPTAPDLELFRFEAVVDWLDVEFSTTEPTQARHLQGQSEGAFSFVRGVDLQTGKEYPQGRTSTTTSRFIARIQAPERYAAITAALDTIRDRLAPSSAIAVCGIEVALDAYAKKGITLAPEELAAMVADFLKGINRVSPNHPRIYRYENETRAIGSHRELIHALMEGFQIGIGDGHGDRFQHGYLKTADGVEIIGWKTDEKTGKQEAIKRPKPLPANKHRARIEIRLQGNACPVRMLDDLAHFDFSSLSDYFRFRQFRESQTDLERLMAERQICLGNIIGDERDLTKINRKGGGTRLNRRGTKSSTLNEKARNRLRKLTERWQAAAGRGKARRAVPMACGNSVCLPPFGDVGQGTPEAVSRCAGNPQEHWAEVAPGQDVNHPASALQEGDGLNTSLSNHPGQGDAPATSTHQAHHVASATGAPSVDGLRPSTPCTDGEGDSMVPATPAPTGDDVSSYLNMTQEDVEWLEEVLKELPEFDAGTAGD